MKRTIIVKGRKCKTK